MLSKKKTTKEIVPVKTMWKSFKPGMQSMYGDTKWEVGKWFTDTKKAETYNRGFHASEYIADAMRYVRCDVLALVEVAGESDANNDKEVWESMRVVKAYQWDKDASVKMAIFAAELTLHIFEKKYPTDLRPRKAIEAAKAYLKARGVEQKKAADAVYTATVAAYTAATTDATTTAAYAAIDAAYAAHAAHAVADVDAADAATVAYAATAADAATVAYAATAADAAAYAAYAAHADADAADAAFTAYIAVAVTVTAYAADAADTAYAAIDADAYAAYAAIDAHATTATYVYITARKIIKGKYQEYIINEILPTLEEYVAISEHR